MSRAVYLNDRAPRREQHSSAPERRAQRPHGRRSPVKPLEERDIRQRSRRDMRIFAQPVHIAEDKAARHGDKQTAEQRSRREPQSRFSRGGLVFLVDVRQQRRENKVIPSAYNSLKGIPEKRGETSPCRKSVRLHIRNIRENDRESYQRGGYQEYCSRTRQRFCARHRRVHREHRRNGEYHPACAAVEQIFHRELRRVEQRPQSRAAEQQRRE